MAATTFFVPVLPGKTEEFLDTIKELTGPRKSDYEGMCQRAGLTRFFYTLQRTPAGDFVVVYMEADDPNAVSGRAIASDHPFDKWFTENVLVGMHGMDYNAEPPPPNEVLFDWHS